MKQNIMFIIFPGHGTTRKTFNDNIVNNKRFTNSDFIPELKKLGEVYFAEQNWNNINYFSKKMIEEGKQNLFNRNKIDFVLEDTDINNACKKIYNNLSNFKGKFVLIGHSIGSLWVYYFSQRYSSRCLFNILIDGSPWSMNINMIGQSKKLNDHFKKIFKKIKYKDIDNKHITKLIKKVREYNDDAINKLFVFTFYKSYIEFPKVKKIKVKTISFKNLKIHTKLNSHETPTDAWYKFSLDNEEYMLQHNTNKYRTIYFVNKTHFPHFYKDSRDIILKTIKGYLL